MDPELRGLTKTYGLRSPAKSHGLQIKHLAEELREVYIRERGRYECFVRNNPSYKYRMSPKYLNDQDGKIHPIWIRATKKLFSMGIDPVDYVQDLFSICRETRRAPFANQLVSEYFLSAYLEGRKNIDEAKICDFRSELMSLLIAVKLRKDMAKGSMEIRDIKRSVLYDPVVSISTLFRYCFAVREQLEDVEAHYRDVAMLQYGRSPEVYDRVWGEWIPKTLKLLWRTNYANG